MVYVVRVEYGLTEKEEPYIIKRECIDKKIAEENNIPHETVLNIVINEEGKILRIRRSPSDSTYPDYNSIPAGHIECCKDEEGNIVPESYVQAALRELKEETGFEPISYKKLDKIVIDGKHVGHPFLMCVEGEEVKYNFEIAGEKSGFEPPEEILDKLEKEKFTPPSREVLQEFLSDYPTTEKTKELYRAMISP